MPVVITGTGSKHEIMSILKTASGQTRVPPPMRVATVSIISVLTGVLSINDIFSKLKDIVGYMHQPIHGEPKLGETRHIYLSGEKACRDLGWQPTINLDEGLERTVDYLKMT